MQYTNEQLEQLIPQIAGVWVEAFKHQLPKAQTVVRIEISNHEFEYSIGDKKYIIELIENGWLHIQWLDISSGMTQSLMNLVQTKEANEEDEIAAYEYSKSFNPGSFESINLFTHFIAGRQSLHAQLQSLQNWKNEAIAVMPDFQTIGKALNIPLGQSIHDKILPYIMALKKENEHLKTKNNDNN